MYQRIISLFILLSCITFPTYGVSIQVMGLFKNKAMVQINGKTIMMEVGEISEEGVKLVKASSKVAVFEYQGQTIKRGLTNKISSTYQKPTYITERIMLNRNGQYIAKGEINGKSINFLVDTGANMIAISSEEADRLGINYQAGRPSISKTASGQAGGFEITLNTVSLGGIQLHNIPAVVIEGAWPEIPLLGMSFLKHLDMTHDDQVLVLKKN